MGLVELKCKSCGANLKVDENSDVFYCEFCDAKLTHEKIYHEISGTVKIDGIAGVDEMLERASILLKNDRFAQANDTYDKILEVSPRCAEGYWGKFLCEYMVSNPSVFIETAQDITNNSNYQLAVDFAEGETKKFYMSIGEQAKEAHEKFISANTAKKKYSRMALYTSFPASVLLLIVLIIISNALENYETAEQLERLFGYEKATMFFWTLASGVSLVSNKILVTAKEMLGENPLDKFKYITWAMFGFAALGFFVTFIF